MGSLTGFLGKARSVARFENEFQTQQGSLYFAPQLGFDFSYWQMAGVDFNASAFNTWIISESVKRSIIMLNSSVFVDGFILKLDYTVAGIQGTQSITNNYGGVIR
ncbi:hypothetical protein HUO09_05415 [Vibrio sp. Y2-5]|uniref:hypothetical protein n=1 Tax=Vibrio sp. Y2-5 TaxID=2743977 RepID=UPI001661619C|nr:hypothetical protein [Vibrio sp. Y2-5]MBD0785770.1 hypothetical protein [Vibrio sp. Y2-5]